MEMSPKELGKHLKDLRESRGLTTREVYKKSKVSNSYLSLVENGQRRASAIVLKKLASAYNVDYLDLYEKAGYIELIEDEKRKKILTPLTELSKNKVPLLGIVKAGYDYLADENIIDYVSTDIETGDIKNYYALTVTGDSMEPLFSDGDIAIVHKQDDFENGNTCIVLVNGEEATVKKVIKRDDGIELVSMNHYYPPKFFSKEDIKKFPIEVIGKVVEARKRKIFE